MLWAKAGRAEDPLDASPLSLGRERAPHPQPPLAWVAGVGSGLAAAWLAWEEQGVWGEREAGTGRPEGWPRTNSPDFTISL